ncbi:DNA polymerase III, alpha subunit (plasmid) [Dinoroseobacter shibae DFL 12 = DSM 16493]|jgi:error-prone DNA polymerase|uniref:Error-prone DNA polymerase n=1 Tax=Dinoroseobacter shibae (strain DSM 16493 / NCIMB 14021 / DFL 12) TaxID=398580 RepID=A8LU17_DINSH|nr:MULTISPECIES: error-prone DNA polymerase [Roseobacteraceae]ABV95725.1 DNA polymerase III, alpha subunit [Dinoroseobacter shibae DFL 12 = DSM 16493]URF49066.1 error-prone DNA polymerase [Dinoroseobacter shibae]URF53375.1 error-prone DNA polymerase [Dinoroseobacter shibae]
MTGYAELCVTSNFTFLTGASHPEELVTRAAELGLKAIAITDRNSVAGVVRAFSALKELARLREEARAASDGAEAGPVVRSRQVTDHSSRQTMQHMPAGDAPRIPPDMVLPKLIPGARIVLTDSPVDWLALPADIAAWSRLTRLLSLGKRRATKGECHLTRKDLLDWGEGMVLIALPPDPMEHPARASLSDLRHMLRIFPGQCFLGAAPRYDGRDPTRLDQLARIAQDTGLPLVALGEVMMHRSSRRPLADVLTCLREGCTIDTIGERRLTNGEHRLKSPAEMARMFHRYPAAIRRTLEIADRCAFRLDDLRYQYPDEARDGEPAQARLERLSREGLHWRYPEGPPARIVTRVDKELKLIGEMGYAPYFLTVHDIVAFARSKGILCQGRGSAANSVVCYLLGVTEVPPESITLIFERFISKERGEPPDIDVDFEHERREEVIQWIYEQYGRHRAGLTATVIHFRSRAAIREVGKVMGLSQDVVARLSGQIWGWSSSAPGEDRMRDAGIDPADGRVALAAKLIGEIIGFPRHLSQHVGGFVITHGRLDELCPIENAAMEDRTVIEWDKDDIDALGLLKVDVLALGMLTCIRKAFGLLDDHRHLQLTLANVPPEDPVVYDMLCKADAVGVFQVESRAQLNFLPRMQPRKFYDLVCEVAIVRPGPIQGGMVHPFINRRQGKEKVEDLGPAMMEVLGRTYGVPLFQEQAMQIAVVAAGFSAAEADRLRRSLATFKRMGTIGAFRERFISGMLARSYEAGFAERCFAQIEGFGSYGFPESHAASFARLVYISAWLKRHHPAVFTCALLNSQPMGFYAPAQLVRDAREHGVEIRAISVNHSAWDCTLEPRGDGALALRLGFRQIKGMREEDANWIEAARGNGYPDVEGLWRRAGVRPDALERLAEGDAFASLGLNRRDALWAARALRGPNPLPLFGADGEGGAEPEVALPAMTLGQEVIEDYLALRLSLRAHPMELLRPRLPESLPHERLDRATGRVTVTGLVITRQRPGTASGVIFLTLEDETGVSNVVVWSRVYEAFRKAVIAGRLLRVTGRIEREGQVVHVIAERIEDISPMLSSLGRPATDAGDRQAEAAHQPASSGGGSTARHPREQAKKLFPSRDFH